MLKFTFTDKPNLNILCLGAHPDDIEIGCGGTLLRLFNDYNIQQICWVVFSSNKTRYSEALASAQQFLKDVPDKTIDIKNFKDGFMPFQGAEIKEYFEQLKHEYEPDIIFTHYLSDRHQDHRLIGDLTWNTFRNHLVLEYEIPKYDGDLGNPNFYVSLTGGQVKKRNRIILDSFESQKTKHWFNEDTFNAMLRIRGMESGNKTAEAFYARKTVL
ncbi:MAG TPA: PIG-L family deacetylase [Bacteroidetes bacterium]|nr:PIG-L family deacetylase [Bacteroidota bacterium]